jgi:GNAT superfamily N-acetyltransferase
VTRFPVRLTRPKGRTLSEKIQAYVRRNAAKNRDTERIGPFLATFNPDETNPFLNYAIPDAGARPAPADVAALVAAYETRGRVPRLEYLPGLAPAVEPVLLDAGFTVESRLPVMMCQRGEEVAQPVPPGIDLLEPSTDEEIRGLLAAQHEAYGEPRPIGDDAVASWRRYLADGGLLVLARDAATREPAGGGVGDPVADGVSEFAGFGVIERYRRRGIAAAITYWLTRAAFAAGAEAVFLTPGGPAQERIYARAGFSPVDEILYIRRD